MGEETTVLLSSVRQKQSRTFSLQQRSQRKTMIRIPSLTDKPGAKSALIYALLLILVELLSAPHLLAQTINYAVVELSAPDADQVPCRLNNLGDLVGRSGDFGP